MRVYEWRSSGLQEIQIIAISWVSAVEDPSKATIIDAGWKSCR